MLYFDQSYKILMSLAVWSDSMGLDDLVHLTSEQGAVQLVEFRRQNGDLNSAFSNRPPLNRCILPDHS